MTLVPWFRRADRRALALSALLFAGTGITGTPELAAVAFFAVPLLGAEAQRPPAIRTFLWSLIFVALPARLITGATVPPPLAETAERLTWGTWPDGLQWLPLAVAATVFVATSIFGRRPSATGEAATPAPYAPRPEIRALLALATVISLVLLPRILTGEVLPPVAHIGTLAVATLALALLPAEHSAAPEKPSSTPPTPPL